MLAKVNLPEPYLETLEQEEDGYWDQDGRGFINGSMADLHGKVIEVRQGHFKADGTTYQWSSARWDWKQEWLDFDLTPEEIKHVVNG